MLIARLETQFKYYAISITEDLFQEMVLICDYGSKRTRFSQRKTILIESLQSGIAMAQKIIKKRKTRGYQTTYNIAR